MQLFRKVLLRIFFVSFLLSLVACTSKINENNFEKIQQGMTMQQVMEIIGQPTSVNSFNIAGISGASAAWQTKNGVIAIQFLNNQVKIKTYSKSNSPQGPDNPINPDATPDTNVPSAAPNADSNTSGN